MIYDKEFLEQIHQYYEQEKDYLKEVEDTRKEFLNKYDLEKFIISNSSDITSKIFGNGSRNKSFVYDLTKNRDVKEYFGGVGTIYNSIITFYGDGKYLYKQEIIDVKKCNELTIDFLKRLNKCDIFIEQWGKNNLLDYNMIESYLIKELDDYYGLSWIFKYFTIKHPQTFVSFYNDYMIDNILRNLNLSSKNSYLSKVGILVTLAKECKVSNVLLHKMLLETCYKDGCCFDLYGFSETIVQEKNNILGENLIISGTPGCGKSHYVNNVKLNGINEENIVRTTFFADYTYFDFIGQILPTVVGEKVTYKFHPGPFTEALIKAHKYSSTHNYLIIDEINRGNAANIFGDIFQLLDRDTNGASKYKINNYTIQKYLNEKLNIDLDNITIPANLSIVATMNTSDQNVFTLDTAFKRRWQRVKLRNKFNDDHPFKNRYILGMDMSWKSFVECINEFIVSSNKMIESEDKQIGVFFIDESGVRNEKLEISSPEDVARFADKILDYLWNDVAKFNRKEWFGEIKTLDDLIDSYIELAKENKAHEVFSSEIFKNN